MRRVINLIILSFFVCAPVFGSNTDDITDINRIIEALGGQEVYDKLPVLDITSRPCNDNLWVKLEDFGSAAIMKGTDKCHRPFITYRLKEVGYTRSFVGTIYQRYTGVPDDWRVTKGDVVNVFSGGNVLTEGGLEIFAKLVKGEVVSSGRDSFKLDIHDDKLDVNKEKEEV